MKIAVIGAGNVGAALGTLWAAKGHEIVFGVRDPNSPKLVSLLNSTGARAASLAEAVSGLEVVALCTPWPATGDAIRACGNLAGKIVIDCTNPLRSDLSGLSVGTDSSGAELVAQWASGGKVVKAFNTTGAGNFGNPRFGAEAASMFIAGDDDAAKATVATLASELSFEVVDTGALSTARWLEPLAMLWIHLAYRQGLGPTGSAFRLLRR
ncbi:MAG TPA: NADPH-dependent F420 reductase [Acidiphilium sp.]